MKLTFNTYLLIVFTLLSGTLKAEPWINTSDVFLKANIQLLADNGHILTPTTTYPLLWNDISRDMHSIAYEKLSANEKEAYSYIKYKLRLAKKKSTRVTLASSTKGSRFSSFGDKNKYQHFAQIQSSYMSSNFAFNVAPGYAYGINEYGEQESEFITDGSYVAASLGNWIISYGKQDKWFGSSWDTSLSVSNNARPMQAFTLSRKSAEPFTLPFTDIDIPWTITTYMANLDDDRIVKDAKLWGFRLNFKPFSNLEIGITRLAQWGGHNQSKTLASFTDITLAREECSSSSDTSCNDNQQAGIDLRLSAEIFDVTFGLYGGYQVDNRGDNSLFANTGKQIGIDTQLTLFNTPTTAFIEYTDSSIDCETLDSLNSCDNVHNIYQTGMRYNGRAIGNLYDKNAKSIVFGMFNQISNDINITNKLRWLDLNTSDNEQPLTQPLIGNPLASSAEQVFMYSLGVEYSFKHWRYTAGGDFSNSSFTNDVADDKEMNLNLTIEYML